MIVRIQRIGQVLELDSIFCPCGCGEMVKVGAERTERRDVIPARLRGLPTEALVAHNMVSMPK